MLSIEGPCWQISVPSLISIQMLQFLYKLPECCAMLGYPLMTATIHVSPSPTTFVTWLPLFPICFVLHNWTARGCNVYMVGSTNLSIVPSVNSSVSTIKPQWPILSSLERHNVIWKQLYCNRLQGIFDLTQGFCQSFLGMRYNLGNSVVHSPDCCFCLHRGLRRGKKALHVTRTTKTRGSSLFQGHYLQSWHWTTCLGG